MKLVKASAVHAPPAAGRKGRAVRETKAGRASTVWRSLTSWFAYRKHGGDLIWRSKYGRRTGLKSASAGRRSWHLELDNNFSG